MAPGTALRGHAPARPDQRRSRSLRAPVGLLLPRASLVSGLGPPEKLCLPESAPGPQPEKRLYQEVRGTRPAAVGSVRVTRLALQGTPGSCL